MKIQFQIKRKNTIIKWEFKNEGIRSSFFCFLNTKIKIRLKKLVTKSDF